MSANTPLRIIVGSDEAGVDYKNAIKQLFEKDQRVQSVTDVGVPSASDHTAYPLSLIHI